MHGNTTTGRRAFAKPANACCSVAIRSAAALDETAYAAARAAMMGFQSDEGRPLGISPTLLVVPPSLEAAALKLVQAENNAAGATNIYRNSAQVLVAPWLA